jgi:hypothetical protein
MGDVAQKAAAWTMQCVVTAVEGGTLTQQQAIDQMYAITNGQSSTVTAPDLFSPAPGWLSNIFTVAGATIPS